MEEKVELLKKLIKKEKELYGEEDSFIAEQIEHMIAYRHIRTEEAWYSKATDGITDRTVMAELIKLGKERREKHNLALSSINIVNRFCEKTGFEKLYDEKTLSNEQIRNHEVESLDIRKQVTDFMLKLVNEIQQLPIKSIEQEENSFIKRTSDQNRL